MRLRLLLIGAAVVTLIMWLALRHYFARRLPNELPDNADWAESTRPVSVAEVGALTATVLFAIALQVPLLTRGFAYDEVWSAVDFYSADSLWYVMSTFKAYNNHILYSILAWLSEAALGRAEWVARLPALILGLATIPALWWFTRPRFGRRAALLAALALATASVHIGFAATARGYTGQLLFTLLSSTVFLRMVQVGTSRKLSVAYILVSWLALYTHLMAASVLAVQVVFLLSLAWREMRAGPPHMLDSERFESIWKSMAAVVLLAFLSYLPVLRTLLARLLLSGSTSAFKPLFPLDVLSYLSGYGLSTPGLILSITTIVGLVWGWRRRGTEAVYIGLLFLLPVGAVWLSRPEAVKTRFFFFLLPFYTVGLVLGVKVIIGALRSSGRGMPSWVGRVAAVAFAILIVFAWARQPWGNVPQGGFRDAVAAMEEGWDPGVGLCALGIGSRFYAYYADQPILIPESIGQFEAFKADHEEIRCAYMDGLGESPHHQEIARFLADQSEPERYHVTWVYRYRP